ncbi:MAG TPA: hypothetical protein VKU01_31740 [Bryobacteraceae bacterium]|nr:hypothetical protein [Bryobacteraceae bacterium]
MVTTLVLTRKPDAMFQNPLFKNQLGRFGTMIVLQGGKVTKIKVNQGNGSNGGSGGIVVPAGVLDVSSDGGAVKEIKRFTTIERMGGYVQLKPQEYNGHLYKSEGYGLRYDPHNSVVAELKGTGGRCFRVLGGLTQQERAILIHEAPHVGYLLGCIGPRQYSDRNAGWSSTAHSTMNELFAISPSPSSLFVLDW